VGKVFIHTGRFGVLFGISGNTEAKIGEFFTDELNKLGSIAKAIWVRVVVGVVLRGVTSEGHNVAESAALDSFEDFADFVPRVTNAGKMGHDLKIEELVK